MLEFDDYFPGIIREGRAPRHNLAAIYANQGRWKEAEGLSIQAMEIRKRVLGKEHADALISMADRAWQVK